MKRILALLILVCWAPHVSAALFPDKSLSRSPLFLDIGGGRSGSGFFLRASNKVFLITAKHVLFELDNSSPLRLKSTNVIASRWLNETTSMSLTINLAFLYDSKNVRYSSDRDVAAIAAFEAPTEDSLVFDRRIVTVNPSELGHIGGTFTSAAIVRLVDLEAGAPVYTFGYPTSIGSKLPGALQLNPRRPLARRGIIADVELERKILVLDLPVYFGNSGGPVIFHSTQPLGVNSTLVVGVVSQFVPFEDVWISERFKLPNFTWSNSGYSIAEPIDHVLSMLW
jgi:hypothetical protein